MTLQLKRISCCCLLTAAIAYTNYYNWLRISKGRCFTPKNVGSSQSKLFLQGCQNFCREGQNICLKQVSKAYQKHAACRLHWSFMESKKKKKEKKIPSCLLQLCFLTFLAFAMQQCWFIDLETLTFITWTETSMNWALWTQTRWWANRLVVSSKHTVP